MVGDDLHEVDSSISNTLKALYPADPDVMAERRIRARIRQRHRRRVTIGASLAVVVLVVAIAGMTRTGSSDAPVAAGGRPDSLGDRAVGAPELAPDVVGLSLADALRLLDAVSVDSHLDNQRSSDDPLATVVSQSPAAHERMRTTSLELTTAAPVPPGQTVCPGTSEPDGATADGLPAAGQTDLQAVISVLADSGNSIARAYGASAVLLGQRSGRVYIPDGTSDPPIEHRDDYQLIVLLKSDADCPAAPSTVDGVPLVFVVN